MRNSAFVCVVCGDDVHINTLNYSLSCLKKFSEKPIFVITDSSRNNVEIDHDRVIDIKTDRSFTHHQAAIFLKTSLHRYIPMDDDTVYCYIDSDLLALSHGVDSVFDHPFHTVGFCKDHTTLDFFSPNAVNCECIRLYAQKKEEYFRKKDEFYEKHFESIAKYDKAIKKYDDDLKEYYISLKKYNQLLNTKKEEYFREFEIYKKQVYDYKDFNKLRQILLFKEHQQVHNEWTAQFSKPETKLLQNELEQIYKDKLRHSFTILHFAIQKVLPWKKDIAFLGYIRDKKTGIWYDKQGVPVLYPLIGLKQYMKENRSRIDESRPPKPIKPAKPVKSTEPVKPSKPIKPLRHTFPPMDDKLLHCTHLHKEIKKEFGVRIKPSDWQHPNGGFFLFDKRSEAFLDKWHELSVAIFSKPAWKTRDQATLAATFWIFELNEIPYLPVEYNYIVDYNYDNIAFKSGYGFSNDGFKSAVNPLFAHVYHHFGDRKWALWNEIEAIIGDSGTQTDGRKSEINC